MTEDKQGNLWLAASHILSVRVVGGALLGFWWFSHSGQAAEAPLPT